MNDAETQAKRGKIMAGCGGALFVLSSIATCVVSLLPQLTNNRVDFEEAAPGIGGTCCCSLVGLAIVAGGVVFLLQAKKKREAGGPSAPGTPPTP